MTVVRHGYLASWHPPEIHQASGGPYRQLTLEPIRLPVAATPAGGPSAEAYRHNILCFAKRDPVEQGSTGWRHGAVFAARLRKVPAMRKAASVLALVPFAFSRRLASYGRSTQIFYFLFSEIVLRCRIPSRAEGRSARSSRHVRRGCDGRWAGVRRALVGGREVVWSWHPDAGVPRIARKRVVANGGQRAGAPRRSRYKR
jgi:hypothetical protein